jgi:hypothetical protein
VNTNIDFDPYSFTVSGSGTQTITRDDEGNSTSTSSGGGSYSYYYEEWTDNAVTVTELNANGNTYVTSHSRTYTWDSNGNGYGGGYSWSSDDHSTTSESLISATEILVTQTSWGNWTWTSGDETNSGSHSDSYSYTSPLYVGSWSPPGYWDVVEGAATLFASRLFGTALGLAAVYGEFLNVDLNFSDPYDDSPATHYTGVYDWIGQNIVLPWVGQERLLEGGRFGTGLLDDLMIAGLLATEIVGYVDPTGVADVLNAGLNAADGNYADALLSLGGALIPGGGDKAARAAGKVGSRAMDGFSSAAKSLSRHTACDAPTSLGRAIGNVRGACFVGETLVVLDFAPQYAAAMWTGEPEVEIASEQPAVNWLLVVGGGAIMVGTIGVAAWKRRREEEKAERARQSLWTECESTDWLDDDATTTLPKVTGEQMEKLCDQLFSQAADADDAAMWSGTESDSQPLMAQVPLPVTQPDVRRKPIKRLSHPSKGTGRWAPDQRKPARAATAQECVAHPKKNRGGASSPTRPRNRRFFSLTLMASLLFGFALLAIGLIGTNKAERSVVAASNKVAQGDVETSPIDTSHLTSHLTSQPLPATQTGKYVTCKIRDLPPGTWLLADNPETEGIAEGEFGEVVPATWRWLVLRMVKHDGSALQIDMLRPVSWIEEAVAREGERVHLEFDELAISGQAEVLEIKPCPQIPPRPTPKHCLVTAKFTHDAANVVDLGIDGLNEAIGVTANHPFWSLDRREFIPAGHLRIGEMLLTAADGETRVIALAARSAKEPVYNLEVDGEHVYYVSSSGVLVHNAGKKYITYVGTDLDSGLKYVGRSSGPKNWTPQQILDRRLTNHHRNLADDVKVDKWSLSGQAIRGREHMMIERLRILGKATDQINGISDRNTNKAKYLSKAIRYLGDL